jgi:GntR family transcriptional regulator/MocR family aminotransferase
MSRRPTGARGAVVLVTLDRHSTVPLHRQVYDDLRRAIVAGRLTRGARLPSTRSLAGDLGVSRSTVVLAFDQLRVEGYLESTGRGSTRVSARLPDAMIRAVPAAGDARPSRPLPRTSARSAAASSAWPDLQPGLGLPARAFRTSVPALDVFPIDTWGRIAARRWRRAPPAALSYGEAVGLEELRGAIADYLTRARAVRCTASQILVTSGSQQALDLAVRVLTDQGDAAWIEDPGYFGAAGAFAGNGVRIVPVPVDADGLDVAAGRRLAPHASLAFVTPARQLPLGVTMSQARRVALLEWAEAARAWVIEDDYDSEFRYATQPLATLQSLDKAGCVIFIGTFSKVMFPALRLGYLVVPEALVPVFGAARRFVDFCPPYHSQAVMADFMIDGHFERHIRRMRAIYQSRRRLLVNLLERHLDDVVEVDAPDAGMNLIAWLPDGTDDSAVAAALEAAGIAAIPLSRFTRRRLRPGLMLGYSGIREPDLRRGVARLAEVLRGTARAAAE